MGKGKFMKTIWKYVIQFRDVQTLYLPKGSTLLSVQLQNDTPYIWALVNPDNLFADEDEISILMFGTGNPIEKEFAWNTQFLGTIQNNGIVFHVFYEEA
jgi:hypothetical protein